MSAVCMDRSIRLNTDPTSQVTTLEVCSEDRWISVNSTLQISNDDDRVISNLEGTQTSLNVISLRWDSVDSIARYEAECSNSQLTSTLQVDGRSTSVILTVLSSSGDYSCCLTAYKERTLFNLVEFTSTECVSVAALPRSTSEAQQQLDPAVTYALGGLSGLLIVAIVLVAVGCFCVVISKRKDQITHPQMYVPTS